MTHSRTTALAGLLVTGSLTLAACGGSASTSATAGSAGGGVTVQNCGQDLALDAPVRSMYAYDGGIIAIALAAGAQEQITAVAGIARDREVLAAKYGQKEVGALREVTPKGPTLESVLAAEPDLLFAGWGYGLNESKNLTPEVLADHKVATYLLSETCRQDDGERGTMPPWEALSTDLMNIGRLTGHEETAREVVDDIDRRRTALTEAPAPTAKPTAFLVDSTGDTIFSSGSFGGPQGIFDAAGVASATADVEDTWTKVSWERLAAADPDVIYLVDYPGQSYEQKIAALRAHPSSRDLKAVRESRFVNLPYAMWVSSPLNIDAAEIVRASLEHFDLAPRSGIRPSFDVTTLKGLPGNDWARE